MQSNFESHFFVPLDPHTDDARFIDSKLVRPFRSAALPVCPGLCNPAWQVNRRGIYKDLLAPHHPWCEPHHAPVGHATSVCSGPSLSPA
jgi:hypothetical protein